MVNRKSQCLSELKARILSQDIAPGSDLDEVALSSAYGISRTPLREVLQRLAGDGYVRLEDNRGAKVASMDLVVLRVFFQTAPLIYCSVARLAAENRTPDQVAVLKDVQKEFALAAEGRDTRSTVLLNHRFHELIGEMAHNPYLAAGLNRMLIDHTRLSQTFFAPENQSDRQRISKAVVQHDAMISAIEARDVARAVDVTREHWDLSYDQMERFVRPDPLPLDVNPVKDRRHAV